MGSEARRADDDTVVGPHRGKRHRGAGVRQASAVST